ncbi:DNA repair metallo-beta-lactamase-domain-containing protein, partial [Phycomyces nitens]
MNTNHEQLDHDSCSVGNKRPCTDQLLGLDKQPKLDDGFQKNDSDLENLNDPFEDDLKKAIKLSVAAVDQERVCPVCDVKMALDDRAMDIHVNNCLDSQLSETLQDDSSKVKVEINKSTWSDILQPKPKETKVAKSILSFGKGTTSVRTTTTSVRSTSVRSTGSKSDSKPKRICPSYKWMKDTPYVVDAFSFGKIDACNGYFLTHYHADHYMGLTKSWAHGPIYCSKITANLVKEKLKVNPDHVVVLPMDVPYIVDEHTTVVLVDANHCPGSVLFLFIVKKDDKTIRHLHTGDFRANPRMCLHPHIRQPENPPIDCLYLDTTYMAPNHIFPAQQECIDVVANAVEEHVRLEKLGPPLTKLDLWLSFTKKQENKRLLIVVGTYTIGKERIFYEIAKRIKSKIYVTSEKKRILLCQENPDLEALLTRNQHEAQVHVIPLNHIKEECLKPYLGSLEPHFTSLIAIRPTGWSFYPPAAIISKQPSLESIFKQPFAETRIKLNTGPDKIKIYSVPYSEHSSFRELAAFVGSLEIRTIIPTVNVGSPESRSHMESIYGPWQAERAQRPAGVVSYRALDHW